MDDIILTDAHVIHDCFVCLLVFLACCEFSEWILLVLKTAWFYSFSDRTDKVSVGYMYIHACMKYVKKKKFQNIVLKVVMIVIQALSVMEHYKTYI